MVTHSATGAAYVPQATPRLAISADGALAAVYDPRRLVVVEIPSCAVCAEIAVDPDAERCDFAWVGSPSRLVVLSSYATYSAVQLVHPDGPRTVAEIRLETPMKLVATVGVHALAVGPLGTAVLTASETHLTPYQFPARSVPVAAGSAAGQFVVALSASVEEWDPQARMPKRRLKLPAPAAISAVGGSDRVVWTMTQQDPTRIDVFAMVNRGQPKRHQLPVPIAHVSGHPRCDLLVCRGADGNNLHVVDLDGKSALRTIDVPGIDSIEAVGLVVGRSVGALAAQANRPLVMVSLGRREVEAAEALPRTSAIPRQPANGTAKRSTLYGDDDDSDDDANRAPPVSPVVELPSDQEAAQRPSVSFAERLSTWRERVSLRIAQPVEVASDLASDSHLTWRDELAAWTRSVIAGGPVARRPEAPVIDEMLERFGLDSDVAPALSLLYGAHLCGLRGAAPVDVARVLDRNWDEALGNGRLHAAGVIHSDESRVRLARCVERALDGLAPETGTLVGKSGAVNVLGPCVVIAPGDDVVAVAQASVASAGGAILAGSESAIGTALALEARAYGAVAMVRLGGGARVVTGDSPLIIIVPDQATADSLGLPVLQ